MISHASVLKPFISEKSCGDFVSIFERENEQVFVLCDVGGHGNQEVGALAQALKTWLSENYQLPLSQLFEGLKSVDGLNKFGATVFIGRVDFSNNLLHYLCVGDIKIYRMKNGEVKALASQQGRLDFSSPKVVKEFVVKLQSNDCIVVTSDGVRELDHCLSEMNSEKAADIIANTLMARCATKADDACCLVLRVNGIRTASAPEPSILVNTKTNSEPLHCAKEITKAKDTPLNVTRSSIPQATAIQKTLPRQYVAMPDKQYFFCSLISQRDARQKIRELKDYLLLNDKQRIAIKSIALEVIGYLDSEISVFITRKKLILTFNFDKRIYEQSSLILGSNHVAISQADNQLIVWIDLPRAIDITSSLFEEFKERVQLGISKDNYAQYQKDQKRDVILSQQARLASMGEMIGAIAHQWRQPLNELALRTQMLKYKFKQGINEEEIDTIVKENLETIGFMSQTIDDFRNFFKIDKNKERFDLAEVIQSVLALQKQQFINNGIALDIHGETTVVEGFKSEFQQVILNIVSNAKDAFEGLNIENKSINITLALNEVSITDNAGGIPANVLDRIFEPYFTTKAHGKGTGMGLYISKMIIEDHMNGEISVENITTPQGKGAAFTIVLPSVDVA